MALVKQFMVKDSENQCPGVAKSGVFFPDLYASQPCESTFRQLRSFTSTFSTVVNFNMLDLIHRVDKIQFQCDIINNSKGTIKFPRFEKKAANVSQGIKKLNRSTVQSEIERARQSVMNDFEKLGIDTSKLNLHCQVRPVFEQNIPESDSDLDSDDDGMELLFNDMEDSDLEDECIHDPDSNDYLSGMLIHAFIILGLPFLVTCNFFRSNWQLVVKKLRAKFTRTGK